MSVFRVNKNTNYTVMSNYHLRDKNLSLKAKGLLSLMLSLPDDWNYSLEGLVAICKENKTSVRATLNELKEFGYLIVWKLYPYQTDTGRISYIYDIYEEPQKQNNEKQEIEKQGIENLYLENLGIENVTQLNTNILNTNIQNTNNLNNIYIKSEKKEKSKEPKKKYGEYQHVLLTETEYGKLQARYGNVDELIKYLDEYIEMKGYKAKSHCLCIIKWVADAVKEKSNKPEYKSKAGNKYYEVAQNEFNDLERFYSN